MKTLVLILLCVVFGALAIGGFWIACKEKTLRREAEKKADAEKQRNKESMEIIEYANEKKERAKSGNHSRDLDTMAGELHDLAR